MNAITLYRAGHWCYTRGIPIVPKLMHRLIFLIYNSSIPMSAEIGQGTTFGHGGMGVVLHSRCRIGSNVAIGQQVTIGGRSRLWGVPVVGDRCFIGAGAKILGPVRIGAESVVGANAVVLEDVPRRSVVAGVPARVIQRDIDITDYHDGAFPPGMAAGDNGPERKVPDGTTVEIIQEPERFELLKQEWNELLRNSTADCLFLTWEWLWTWWKNLAEGRKLFLITVRCGRELVAIAPFAVRSWTVVGLIPCRSLEFLGTGSVGSDYLDLIIRRGKEPDICRLLADFLAQERLMVMLTHLNRRSSLVAGLTAELQARGWGCSEAKINLCPLINLSGHSWESYLASLGPEHRYNFQRRLKNLAKQATVEFESVRSEEQRRVALANLITLHHQRWRDRGGSDGLHKQSLLAFHEELSRLALERGWLRLFMLLVDGQPAASLYGFRYHRTFYFYQSGFDPRYSKHSVGLVAMGLAIKSAIEEGADEYDLLHGHESYKFLWAREARELGRVELYPPYVGGLIRQRAVELDRATKRLAREAIPHAVADRLSSVRRAEI